MKLKDEVRYTLDESRILVLGAQILLGFDFESFLMKRFDALGAGLQRLQVVSLGLMLATLVLLLSPTAHHRLVARGEDDAALVRFGRVVIAVALFTFALGLASGVGLVVARVAGAGWAIAAGIVTAAGALAAWYALPWRRAQGTLPEDDMQNAPLDEKIRHLLIEARVVLPGTQALLGFQFIGALEEGFDPLPSGSKAAYVGALALLAASVVLLMLPAAYHRIAERGEISDRLERVSSRALVAAMIALAGAIALDSFIVLRRATGSIAGASVFAVVFAVAALGTWVVLMLVLRRRREGMGSASGAHAAA